MKCSSRIAVLCLGVITTELGQKKFIEHGLLTTISGLLSSEQLSAELQETVIDLLANLAETGLYFIH